MHLVYFWKLVLPSSSAYLYDIRDFKIERRDGDENVA